MAFWFRFKHGNFVLVRIKYLNYYYKIINLEIKKYRTSIYKKILIHRRIYPNLAVTFFLKMV